MKKLLQKVKKALKSEIEFAKEAGFGGILIALDDPDSYIYLETLYDIETLEEIVIDNGWGDHALLIDFTDHCQKIIYFQEAVA